MQRIGLIESVSNTVVTFLGYGEYLGEFDIDPHELGFTDDFSLKAPKFKLDDGREFHGIDYWWASEEEVRSKIDKYKNLGYEINIK